MTPNELLAASRHWHDSGNLAQAETGYRQLLVNEPANAELWYLLGTASQSLGKLGEAKAAFERSVSLKPGFAPAHNSLGITHAQQGRAREAEKCFAAAVDADPSFAHAHNNLGNARKEQGRLEEALVSYQQAVRLKHDFAEAYNNLGNLQRELGQLDEALANCREALRLRPDMPDALNNLGAVHTAKRQWSEAADCFRKALTYRPDHAEACGNLAMALRELGEIEEAIVHFRHALRLRPDFAEAHGALAMALSQQGDLEGALASCREALRLKPELASAHLSMGFLLSELGRRDEAIACCDRALELEPDLPDAHKNRSLIWLLEGKLAEGWQEYEWRWKCPELPERPFQQPLWDGAPLAGRTILLHAEQGLGDTLHFIRYASLVRDRGGRVLLVCQRPLVSLLARAPGVEQVVAQGDPIPAFDTHAPLLGLPRIFGTTLENVPAQVPYLIPDAAAAARWRDELSATPGLKIGIAWQGSRTHRRDRGRSIPLRLFAPLADLPGVQLYSLQKNFGQEQLAQVAFRDRVIDLSSRLDTFDDTAAVVDGLDLVIACDTSLVHLAGGLGKPTWIAITAVPDWRWLLEREDSVWYPTARLFRQRKRGDWQEVFERMTTTLAAQLGVAAPSRRREEASSKNPPVERVVVSAIPSKQENAPLPTMQTKVVSGPVSFDEARRQHQAGNVEQAVGLYRQVLLKEPNNAQAWYLMGAAFAQLGQHDDARASLRQATGVNPWHIEAHNHLGVVLAQQALLDEAIGSFRRALELRPDHLEALNNLGLALLRQDKPSEAIAIFQRALAIKPDDDKARHNLNRALREQGHFEELLTSQRQAVGQYPQSAQAHNDLGLTLYEQGRFDEAAAAFQSALEVKPDLAEAHNNLGLVQAAGSKLDEAIASYRRAIVLKPSFAEAHNNLGIALRQAGQAEAAVASCREAARLKPELPEAHNNLGSALEEVGRYEEAITVLHESLRVKPDFAKAHNNLGIAYWYLGRFDEAAKSYRRATELMPEMAEAHNNLGNVLRDQGDYAGAEACYHQAADLKPNYADPHWNQSLLWLLQGDFERGWQEYEWRWKLKNFKPRACEQPLWDGSSLEGKTILLAAEQGLGDTIQFIRYAPLVKARGARVLAEIQRPLKAILSTCAGIDQWLVQGEPAAEFDTYATLLSLPLLLGTTLQTVPAEVPYLWADPELIDAWRDEIKALPGLKVGIAWKGSPQNRTDRGRSLPLALFEVLAKVPGVTLVSLQKGQGSEQIAEVADRFRVIDLGERLDATAGPFMDTAAIMEHLDLVITCDSSLAHLAGALGVPVWIALMLTPDWRWLTGSGGSPWYPTARLFRQTQVADWPGVFDRMAAALEKLVSKP
ncbi:MAG TPA: tetratricopeptide repeat protein [Pirellulales bacterium]